MNIHIVHAQSDSPILDHLIRILQEGTGWTVGQKPRASADANYFWPYIWWSQNFPGWRETPIAAYMSHEDTNHPTKLKWWNDAAEAMDMRLTVPRLYANSLSRHGLTARITPPVDDAFFAAAPTRNPNVASAGAARVGVAGWVYGDGRKGEDLVARLAADMPGVEWQAVGKGWPVQTRKVERAALPGWFAGLDVFLCASRIEGVPMTILEALAVGVRVVVPAGVGVVDDLPEHPDIIRYTPGDYDSLREAVRWAVTTDSPTDRVGLKNAARPYTAAAWVNSHALAFERLLAGPAQDEIERKAWPGNAAIYSVAYGDPARARAVTLAESVRKYMPRVPLYIASEKPVSPYAKHVSRPDTDIGGRGAKLDVWDLAPPDADYVLYLDADTELTAPIPFLFDALVDGWDMVITKNPARFHSVKHMVRPDNRVECAVTIGQIGSDELMQLNGGVFGFHRNPRTERFFKAWREEWSLYGERDQPALLRALWKSPVRTYVLGSEWNTVDRYVSPDRTAGIVHRATTARRWSGLVHGRLDSDRAWQMVEEWQRDNKK